MLRGRKRLSAVKTVNLLIVAALGISAPSRAQVAEVLIVRSASDPATHMLVGGASLPPEAFDLPEAFSMFGMKSEINSNPSVVADVINQPGREDARPRVLHTGTEATFKSAIIGLPVINPRLRNDWMLSHHIDVGQGNATLLEFSCGLALIDTGGQETATFNVGKRLVEYLNSVFTRRPDLNRTISLVLLTHPHTDHTQGVLGLLAAGPLAFKISNIVINGKISGSGWSQQKKLIAHAKAAKIPLTVVTNESIVRSDGLTSLAIDPINCAGVDPEIRVLWGSDSNTHSWAKDGNNHSVVARVDFGQSSFLFTGDLEENAQPELLQSYLRNPEILDVDVYQVGHHGSRNGTTAALLKAITPEIAVIGAGNPADEELGWSAFNYGHPNLATITLLSDPSFGVSKTRKLGQFAVGISGRAPNGNKPPRYQLSPIAKAIFSTGWDGDIIIAASSSGQKVMQID
jgi:competence protein ComEC